MDVNRRPNLYGTGSDNNFFPSRSSVSRGSTTSRGELNTRGSKWDSRVGPGNLRDLRMNHLD